MLAMKNVLGKITRRFYLWAILGRVGMSPLTASVPVLGALSGGGITRPNDLLGLGLVGLCAHLFGFALNDLLDRDLDRTVPNRQRHPLAEGTLGVPEAWLFTLAQPLLAVGIYHWGLGGSWSEAIWLMTAILLSIVYDVWGKRGPVHPFWAELALAASVSMLCLSGAALTTETLPPQSVVFAIFLGLVLLLLNSVPSGLKDLKTDSEFGVRNFVATSGTKMRGSDEMHISLALRIYSAGLQAVILAGLPILAVLLKTHWIAFVMACILSLYAVLHLHALLKLSSFAALRRSIPLLSGYYNYLALALLLFPWMPGLMRVLYGLLILACLAIPWRSAFRVWRRRYHVRLTV